MRDILIVLLAVLFTIMTIILFEIKSMSHQFLTLVIVLLAFIIFYMIVDKIHLFKDSDNEVNINNTVLEDKEMDFEDEALDFEDEEMDLVIDNQNVVEVEEETEPNNVAGMTSNQGFKMVMESTENCGIHENIKNPDYTIQNIDTTDFGVIRDKIAQTLN